MHISKRTNISTGKAWLIRAVAILGALIVCAFVIFAIVKMNPLKVYVSMFNGSERTSVSGSRSAT